MPVDRPLPAIGYSDIWKNAGPRAPARQLGRLPKRTCGTHAAVAGPARATIRVWHSQTGDRKKADRKTSDFKTDIFKADVFSADALNAEGATTSRGAREAVSCRTTLPAVAGAEHFTAKKLPASPSAIVGLRVALRRERQSGLSGHPGYSIERHESLSRKYQALRRGCQPPSGP